MYDLKLQGKKKNQKEKKTKKTCVSANSIIAVICFEAVL
jgi:hypothetical protein